MYRNHLSSGSNLSRFRSNQIINECVFESSLMVFLDIIKVIVRMCGKILPWPILHGGPSAANGAYAGGDAACWVAAASDGGICPSNGPKCGMATANDVPSVWHGSSATESPSVWMVATAVCRWFWTCLSAAPCECLWATTNRPECDCRGL